MESKSKYKTLISLAAFITAGILFWYKFHFLRKPKRSIISSPDWLLSPAMGKIVAVREFDENTIIENKYEDEDKIAGAIRIFSKDVSTSGTIISTHLSLNDVHFQRCPIDSKVVQIYYVKGDFKNAISTDDEGKIRYENEHCAILFETESGFRYKVVLIAGFIARKIEVYVKPNQFVKQGEVFSLIKMGSQVTTLLPSEVKVVVSAGEKVVDGESIIGIIE